MKEYRFSWILGYLERGGHRDGRPSSLQRDHPRAGNTLPRRDYVLRSRAGPSDLDPAECPITACDRAESFEFSPTRRQVDAYMRLLEWQLKRKNSGIPLPPAEKRRAAGGAVQHLLSRVLLYGMIALLLGCSAWLLRLMYEAFD